MVSPLSLHSVCGFHGASSVFAGSSPGGGALQGSGLQGFRDKKGVAGLGWGGLGHLKKLNKKLAVGFFLLTVVNS